ncbi:hypothetical protein [Demequina salsinemoris]|uniref:hypothetical protein n=1 Tax=Demequina salsinemoris TaxID=577470 RepID=UPI000783131A|nr:hypothetical protein [Demequina salsinemoris]
MPTELSPLSLEGLAKATNVSTVSGVGLTLSTGGLVITGELVSARDYWGRYNDGGHAGDVGVETLAALAGDLAHDPTEGMIEFEERADTVPTSLYLRDVQIAAGDHSFAIDWYRVFIAHVTGFALGRVILA